MSCLFRLGDDGLRYLISWLDFASIGYLDIAVGNVAERLLWLHSLLTIDTKAIDEYRHSHASIRWMIMRGTRTTIIRVKDRSDTVIGRQGDDITDETFADLGLLYSEGADTLGFGSTISESILRLKLRNSDIGNFENYLSSNMTIRSWSCSHLTLIHLRGCLRISDFGLSAIAQGCPRLTCINLHRCEGISDIGISAIAQGCPSLTLIYLGYCSQITDIGASALAEGCPQLTLIDFLHCFLITDIGVSAIAQGCPKLTHIQLTGCYCVTESVLSDLRSRPHLNLL